MSWTLLSSCLVDFPASPMAEEHQIWLCLGSPSPSASWRSVFSWRPLRANAHGWGLSADLDQLWRLKSCVKMHEYQSLCWVGVRSFTHFFINDNKLGVFTWIRQLGAAHAARKIFTQKVPVMSRALPVIYLSCLRRVPAMCSHVWSCSVFLLWTLRAWLSWAWTLYDGLAKPFSIYFL